MIWKRLLVLFAFLTLTVAPVKSQIVTAGTPAPDEKEKAEAQAVLEKKALALVEEAVNEANGLKLAENRIQAQVIAASLSWPRDADAARVFFQQAAEGIAALIAQADAAQSQYHNDRYFITQLRSQLILSAAPYDAKLALEFLRATRQPAPFVYPDAEYRQPDQEVGLELSLAAQVAAQDPAQALRMAEEGLSRGVSQNLISVLHQLVTKDKDGAKRLATAIIKRLRPEVIARDYEASGVAIQLFTMTRAETPFVAEAAAQSSANNEGQVFVRLATDGKVTLDDQTRKQLVGMLVTAGLMDVAPQFSGVVQNILNTLRNSPTEVERYAPTRVAAIKQRAVEIENRNDPRGRVLREYREVLDTGSIEAMLETAPKAPPEVRDQLYTNASWKALNDNNMERARQIAESIANPERRAQVLRDLERQFRMRAAEQGNIQDARLMVSRIQTVEEKVSALTHLSSVALNRGDKATARELLQEARTIIGRGENASQFYSLFALARAYAQLDEGVSFEIIEGAIERLNELIEAAVVVNGFGHEAFVEGELKQQGGYMWNDLINRCAQELGALASKDFERARATARRFHRTDARTTAQLMLSQKILQGMMRGQFRHREQPLAVRVVKSGG